LQNQLFGKDGPLAKKLSVEVRDRLNGNEMLERAGKPTYKRKGVMGSIINGSPT